MQLLPTYQKNLGVLLTNIGTPNAPTAKAVRRYLAEFLADPRIVKLPRLLWWPILHGIILNIRPRRSATAYQKIWTQQGSPLLSISQSQTIKLQQALEQRLSQPVKVVLGMRYGEPSITTALQQLHEAAIDQLCVLPLFPQYSSTTTASVFDVVSQTLQQWINIPKFYFQHSYATDNGYIAALVNSIKAYWQQYGRSKYLLFSFHGIPQSLVTQGDPYFYECQQTTALVAKQLQLADSEWRLVFQSRFGYQQWLKPYCVETLIDLAKQGMKEVDIICPGFSADCLETLEEISMQNQTIFIKNGGEKLRYIPALNDHNEHITVLANTVMKLCSLD